MPSWTSTGEDVTYLPRVASNPLVITEGIIIGVVYGVVLRVALGHHAFFGWLGTHGLPLGSPIMTLTFLLLAPVIIGVLTIAHAQTLTHVRAWQWVVAPWLAVCAMMLVLALFAWEGSICIIMALPIALIFASVGGVIAGLFNRWRKPSRATLTCVAVLPFVMAPLEASIAGPTQTRTVASQIVIHAAPETVWRNIERVPAIAGSELRPDWTHRIGFPRPVEATLSYEGVGGIRHASFEHGLVFIETVTAWEPEQRLAFTIRADTANIPATTLDEHVTIGGRYFDVLDGEYSLEPLSNGDIRLHLTSHQRLSTDFNSYAGLWTDAVMQNLQRSILQVIQHRCEQQ